jgi:hypothetical protein
VAAAIARITRARHEPVSFEGIELRDEHAGRCIRLGGQVGLRQGSTMPLALLDPSADLGLSGARAVVTGGTRGISAATVSRLAAAGAHVVAIARSQADVPTGVHLITADLNAPGGTEVAMAASLDRLGGIDVLTHAADAECVCCPLARSRSARNHLIPSVA